MLRRRREESRDPPPSEQSPPERLCDYDTSATTLYEMLESSNWDEARSRCRSHPEEARTWIVRKDKSLQVRWKLLPLHAAIIFQSPNFVVSSLLEKYPAAASRQDDQGMLPLHLAFRHKQEDEDLLELLLVQFPKAVIMKDRRDRVPLEHGRDCKYSAKLMRLYADATVAGSRALAAKTLSGCGMNSNHTATTSTNTSVRQKSETEHENQIAALRAKYDSNLQYVKQQFEERINTLREKNTVNTRQMRLSAAAERQVVAQQHQDEMNDLRDLLSQQVGKDRDQVKRLRSQVENLQRQLQQNETQNESSAAEIALVQAYAEELKEHLEQSVHDQLQIRNLALQQQDELDSQRQLRTQLVETLLQQEDSNVQNDRLRGSKMLEVSDSIRNRITDLLESAPSLESRDRYGYNRVRKARKDTVELVYSSKTKPSASDEGVRLQMDQNMNRGSPQEQHYSEEPIEVQAQEFFAEIPQPTGDVCGQIKILGDDISAITDHSHY